MAVSSVKSFSEDFKFLKEVLKKGKSVGFGDWSHHGKKWRLIDDLLVRIGSYSKSKNSYDNDSGLRKLIKGLNNLQINYLIKHEPEDMLKLLYKKKPSVKDVKSYNEKINVIYGDMTDCLRIIADKYDLSDLYYESELADNFDVVILYYALYNSEVEYFKENDFPDCITEDADFDKKVEAIKSVSKLFKLKEIFDEVKAKSKKINSALTHQVNFLEHDGGNLDAFKIRLNSLDKSADLKTSMLPLLTYLLPPNDILSFFVIFDINSVDKKIELVNLKTIQKYAVSKKNKEQEKEELTSLKEEFLRLKDNFDATLKSYKQILTSVELNIRKADDYVQDIEEVLKKLVS